MDREFDVVVWGATGFTGALVAEYLMAQYGCDGELRWAIAGRSPEKLAAVKDSLGPDADGLSVLTADSMDRNSLDSLVAQTSVIITTVGPYAKYGTELLRACVSAGTDYCDLCAEVQWIRRMMDELQEEAQQTGARILNCCGYDSIPSDLGVQFMQEQVKQVSGEYCRDITMVVKAAKGGASGGTAASIVNLVKETRSDPEARRHVAKPYSLNPPGQRTGPAVRDQSSPNYFDALGAWTAPFVMAVSNTRIVRRSHALDNFRYGTDFRYQETMATGTGIGGWLKAASISAGLTALLVGAAFAPTRGLLERFVLPKPGEGPDAEARANGFFNHVFIGTTASGSEYRARVTGDRDPGYGSTSKMLSECAVSLAKGDSSVDGGFWTTATALGQPLRERLIKNAGLTFGMLETSND